MELTEGLLFANRYRLRARKGRGSFGEVWLATDEELDLDVAIKIYIALDNNGLEDFKQEYKTAFKLNHPNLLHAYYFGVWENQPFLTMPYCPDSAVALIGAVSESVLWKFIYDVSSGLQYLHEKDIVHRDIKPDNVLRSPEGDFLITDFGVSRKMRSTFRRNSTRQLDNGRSVAGAVSYMGPECFSASPESVFATDIWALGATICELITGETPFMGQGGVMLLHGAEMPILSGYSQELTELVYACLAKETWDRPTASRISQIAYAKLNDASTDDEPIHSIEEPTFSPRETRPIEQPEPKEFQTVRQVPVSPIVEDAQESLPVVDSIEKKMTSVKTFLLVLVGFVCLSIVFSVISKINNRVTYLYVNGESYTFTPIDVSRDDQTIKFDIETDAKEFYATFPAWITQQSRGDDYLILHVLANTDMAIRSGYIRISAGDLNYTVQIRQSYQLATDINVDESTYTISKH